MSAPEPVYGLTDAQLLLRMRWAEALLCAADAEEVIAHYASIEAQLAAATDRSATGA